MADSKFSGYDRSFSELIMELGFTIGILARRTQKETDLWEEAGRRICCTGVTKKCPQEETKIKLWIRTWLH